MIKIVIRDTAEKDNSTVEVYMKDLKTSGDPVSAMIYGFFKAAVLNGFCEFDDKVDVAQDKIEKSLFRKTPAG